MPVASSTLLKKHRTAAATTAFITSVSENPKSCSSSTSSCVIFSASCALRAHQRPFAGSHEGRGWWIFFGIISLIAGIVVAAVPVSSVTALAVLTGIRFVVVGLFEIVGGLVLRHAISKSRATMVSPPLRAGEGAAAV